MDPSKDPGSQTRVRTARRLEVVGAVLFFGGLLGAALPGVARPAQMAAGLIAIGLGAVAAVLARAHRRSRG